MNKIKKELKTGEKVISISKYLEKTATKMQLYVRLRDTDNLGWWECCTCWKPIKWDEGNGWHRLSRKNKSTILDEQNIHLQCPICNKLWGYPEKHMQYISDTYWHRMVTNLIEQSRQVKKRTVEELDQINQELDEKIKRLKENKGIL